MADNGMSDNCTMADNGMADNCTMADNGMADTLLAAPNFFRDTPFLWVLVVPYHWTLLPISVLHRPAASSLGISYSCSMVSCFFLPQNPWPPLLPGQYSTKYHLSQPNS
jgi:hypothetical protein